MTAPAYVGEAPASNQDTNDPKSLAFARTPDYPPPGSPDKQKVVDYVQRLMNDGQFDKIGRFKIATQHLLFVDGRQHIDWALRERVWMDTPTIDGKTRVTMNYIRPILRSRIQRLTSPQMSWRAVPKSNDYEERDRATVGSNFLQDRWKKTDMEAKTRAGLWLAFGCGASWLKSFWNPKIGTLTAATVIAPHPSTNAPTTYSVDQQGNLLADGEGNPIQDGAYKYRPGDVDTAVRSIFNIQMNRDAAGMDDAEGFRWLIDTEIIPISVVKEKYGAAAKDVSTVAGITTIRNYESIVRSIAAPYGTITGNDLLTGRDGGRIPDRELTLLSEYWEAPSELLPEGRLITIGGNVLLYDGPLPQGIVPYVPLYDERRPYDPYGRASTRDLISPQKVINQQWGLILQEQALSGIGQWVGLDVPGVFDQVTNVAGGHIRIPMNSAVMNKPLEQILHKVGPVQVSPDRWKMIEAAQKVMFDIGSFHEIQRGQVPPGVDSGIAVQLLQEAEAGQMADPVQQLKKSYIDWGRQQLKIARWGYDQDDTRWLPVHRPDLDFEVESITGEDLPDPDDIDIDLEGFKPQSAAAQRADIKDLMEKFPEQFPFRQGLQLMDMGRGIDGAFASQTRHYAKARKENIAFEKGEIQTAQVPAPPPDPMTGQPPMGPDGQPIQPQVRFLNKDQSDVFLPDDDDHAIHIDVHQEIALDTAKPWPVRQAILEHIDQHRQAMEPPPKPPVAVSVSAKSALSPDQMTALLAKEGIQLPPAPPPMPPTPPGNGNGAPNRMAGAQ